MIIQTLRSLIGMEGRKEITTDPQDLKKNLIQAIESIPENDLSDYIRFLQGIIKLMQTYKEILGASSHTEFRNRLIDQLEVEQLANLTQLVYSLKNDLFHSYSKNDGILGCIYKEQEPQKPSIDKVEESMDSIKEFESKNFDSMSIISSIRKQKEEEIKREYLNRYSNTMSI